MNIKQKATCFITMFFVVITVMGGGKRKRYAPYKPTIDEINLTNMTNKII